MRRAARFAEDSAVLKLGVREHGELRGWRGYGAQAQEYQICADRTLPR